MTAAILKEGNALAMDFAGNQGSLSEKIKSRREKMNRNREEMKRRVLAGNPLTRDE